MLFAAGVLLIVFLCLIVAFVQTRDMSKKIDMRYIASNIAKNRLENARTIIETKGFNQLDTSFNETEVAVNSDGEVAESGLDFKRSTAVSQNYASNGRLTQVTVTVAYFYKGKWWTEHPLVMTTVFPDMVQT